MISLPTNESAVVLTIFHSRNSKTKKTEMTIFVEWVTTVWLL